MPAGTETVTRAGPRQQGNTRIKFGALLMPSHPPERTVKDGQLQDLHQFRLLDELGFEEAWVGEHFTAAWEPCPAPDLLIAQALQQTKHIRLGPLGHLLPYHHPVELAHRAAYLDHMAGGRYQLGAGISALPTDHEIFGLDASGARNRRMTYEALEIITRLWAEGAHDFTGEFWSLGRPSNRFDGLGYHLRPYQTPRPPIAITGLTPDSENLKLAGEKDYVPVSLSISPDPAVIRAHWDAVSEGAARTGRTPDRAGWRIIRDVFVAPTDAEARALAIRGPMGRRWGEFLLPLYLGLGLGHLLKLDPEMPDEAVDLEYLAANLWLVGSPSTVADKILSLYEQTGGFGYLVITCYDTGSLDEHAAWDRSMQMVADDVRSLRNPSDVPGATASGGRL